MIVTISSDAEADIADGYWFYERQAPGLGRYFRDCLLADIDSLTDHAGIHERSFGHYRLLARRFPYAVYYDHDAAVVVVFAVLDARRDPQWTQQRLQ